MKHAFSKVLGYITYLLAYVLSTFVETRCYVYSGEHRRTEIILFGKNIQLIRVYRITNSGLRTIYRSVRHLSIDEVLEVEEQYLQLTSRKDLVSSRTKQNKEARYGNSKSAEHAENSERR
nr:hypothetical protein [Picobirnavirus sp.]